MGEHDNSGGGGGSVVGAAAAGSAGDGAAAAPGDVRAGPGGGWESAPAGGGDPKEVLIDGPAGLPPSRWLLRLQGMGVPTPEAAVVRGVSDKRPWEVVQRELRGHLERLGFPVALGFTRCDPELDTYATLGAAAAAGEECLLEHGDEEVLVARLVWLRGLDSDALVTLSIDAAGVVTREGGVDLGELAPVGALLARALAGCGAVECVLARGVVAEGERPRWWCVWVRPAPVE